MPNGELMERGVRDDDQIPPHLYHHPTRGNYSDVVREEVNMTQDQWYVSMAAAIKRRDHAIRMLNRWQQQLADAEHQIEKLATGAEQETVQEQEQVHDSFVQ